MKRILIFAGTTEGRRLSECLAEAGIGHTVCVATEYGEIVLMRHPLVTVRRGRMDADEIETFLKDGQFDAVVDATHPFAEEITRNLQKAWQKVLQSGNEMLYLRLKRDSAGAREDGVMYFKTNEACACALEHTKGNILLTTGSKELPLYCARETVKNRLYVRVLPSAESLLLCERQGIRGKQVIAMQGPFSAEMNAAMFRQYDISCLVTKESGASGGYPEKIEAAKKAGVLVFTIGCPKEEGDDFVGICQKLEDVIGKKIQSRGRLEIILAGVGMGHEDGMTGEVKKAVEEADVVYGAERLICHLHTKAKKRPYYRAEQILPDLRKLQGENPFAAGIKVTALFSGDSGFYSGCGSFYAALDEEIAKGRLQASLRVLPGISSVAYLAACVGESYQDAATYSTHGKTLNGLADRIKHSPKTFLLTSGVSDIRNLGRELLDAGLSECEIVTGYRLSYEDQRIERLTPSECLALKEEGLYTCLIKNPSAEKRKLTCGIADDEFIRGKVPMTKEEVREISICKLHIWDGAIVYDIGSGTGSIAVEIAALSDDVKVYAVERKQEAVSLIEKNKQKFGTENLTIVEAEAPEGLLGLPAATHALIGGSGGKLKEILAVLRKINGRMRVAIHAVSLETVSEIREILSLYPVEQEEVVQIQAARAKKTGSHHLMRAENPVFLCVFTFVEGQEPENPDCAADKGGCAQRRAE